MSSGDSEFKQLIDTFRQLGIPHSLDWGPTKERWQKAILDAGYNLTAIACTVVVVGSEELLFSCGQAHWDETDTGYGPAGLFLLARNRDTGIVRNRAYYNMNGDKLPETGLDAMKRAYSNYPWGNLYRLPRRNRGEP